jgi:hypothetical protein
MPLAPSPGLEQRSGLAATAELLHAGLSHGDRIRPGDRARLKQQVPRADAERETEAQHRGIATMMMGRLLSASSQTSRR